jgi:DNA methyltransferase 1-associated protein 1
MEYSQYEYDQSLTDPNWTPQETTYLFGVLKEYDLRFIVAADRYEYHGPAGIVRRSVEVSQARVSGQGRAEHPGNQGPLLHDLQATHPDA